MAGADSQRRGTLKYSNLVQSSLKAKAKPREATQGLKYGGEPWFSLEEEEDAPQTYITPTVRRKVTSVMLSESSYPFALIDALNSGNETIIVSSSR